MHPQPSPHMPKSKDAQLSRPRGTRSLVAAVCFRILSTEIEFLLVRTRRGRWTFPKGGTEPGLTHAQSAALEALEEAGVHGRIEEISFLTYRIRRSGDAETIHAHLCEVLWQSTPEEAYRSPTWFSSEKAKGRLAQGRSLEDGAELAEVVERAAGRVRRLPSRNLLLNDPLTKVRFESMELRPHADWHAAQPRVDRSLRGLEVPASRNGIDSVRGRVLQIRPARPKLS
jgi:8-oxo-dGTP pyrophosphatase MutT (NUDIX family)